jgi:spore coat polysaccharide biosynthesis predicted glycosyltransferase SpsG
MNISNIMKVAFRVDGNKKLGLGHLKRCVVLAKNLQKRNVSCLFIIQFKGIKDFLDSKGFEVYLIQQKTELEQIQKILSEQKCHTLVIDSKRKSLEMLLKNLDKEITTVLIDNENFWNLVDLIVVSAPKYPKKNYPENCIVGLDYLLHGIEELPENNIQKNNSILLSMGGSDKYNITKKIVHSFSKRTDDFDLVVVLGKFYDDEKMLLKIIGDDKRFHIVQSPSSLTDLMQKSSIGLVTFGITVYEAAICHTPLLVISHSAENDASSKLVEKYGWISYVGKYDKIDYDNLVTNTLDLMKNTKKLKNMKRACLQIDGLGPTRIANHILAIK